AMRSVESLFAPTLMPSTPPRRSLLSRSSAESTPKLLKPIRLMIARSSIRRNSRRRGLPVCGSGVSVPASTAPNPSAHRRGRAVACAYGHVTGPRPPESAHDVCFSHGVYRCCAPEGLPEQGGPFSLSARLHFAAGPLLSLRFERYSVPRIASFVACRGQCK